MQVHKIGADGDLPACYRDDRGTVIDTPFYDCGAVQVKDKAMLKDCQIGPGFTVAGNVDYKGEVLAKGQASA